jgi:hypothetical protein
MYICHKPGEGSFLASVGRVAPECCTRLYVHTNQLTYFINLYDEMGRSGIIDRFKKEGKRTRSKPDKFGESVRRMGLQFVYDTHERREGEVRKSRRSVAIEPINRGESVNQLTDAGNFLSVRDR